MGHFHEINVLVVSAICLLDINYGQLRALSPAQAENAYITRVTRLNRFKPGFC